MSRQSLLLVGCGRMGSALLGGWVKSANFSSITAIEPYGEFPDFPVTFHKSISEITQEKNFDTVVYAVKPKDLDVAIKDSLPYVATNALLVSIAAGRTVASMKKVAGEKMIVRVMPNLPALISLGVSVLYADGDVSADKKSVAEELMKAVGETYWVENEKLMNPVTALSGSGPAYLFLIADALTIAATELGIEPGLARRLCLHTMIGSSKMALDSKLSLAELADQVTSPGGTTEAARKELSKDNRLKDMLSSAIKSAAKRAEELEG